MCDACLGRPEPFVAEYFCRDCGTAFLNAFPLDLNGRCGLCRAGARGFNTAYCFGAYEGALRDLIHLLKYQGMHPLARPLGGLLAKAIPIDAAFDLAVPMPLYWTRRWRRGFNQALLLAREVARRRGLPLARAVRRVRDTRSQTGLSPAQRRENVAGAFRVSRPASVRGKRILLIDDVMTTGATGAACALALGRAGARSVTLATLARADRRMQPASVAKSLTVGAT